MATTAAQQKAQAQQANMMARAVCVKNGLDMIQSIYNQTFSSSPAGQVINVPVRNVGLIKRFYVEVVFTFTPGAQNCTRTPFGAANVLSNVTFTDLSNQTRINTSGWHLNFLATARAGLGFGGAFTNDLPQSLGSNYAVMSVPSTATASTATTGRVFYEVPISYSDTDLRGAIWGNVVNATMNLQLTINPNFSVISTADPLLSVYQSAGAAAGSLTSVTVNVYQHYLDQIPPGSNGAPMVPMLDIATNYLLNNTVMTGITAGQDNTVPYANFRSFMSTFAVYHNTSTPVAGTDLHYWGLQSANYTNIWKMDPFQATLLSRQRVHDDFPAGVYYFDTRTKPLETVQYGNLQLLFNPVAASATAEVLVGYEMLALANVVTNAGSLYNT